MVWFGLQIAKAFGKTLPSFRSQAEAEMHLFGERDRRLHRIVELAASSNTFAADYTPESLKNLEKWYFELWESDGFGRLSVARDEFERCMASYFCEIAVRNCPDTNWEVREFGFERGKYEIGVGRPAGGHLMLSRFTDHHGMPRNKRRQKIYRDYQQRFGVLHESSDTRTK